MKVEQLYDKNVESIEVEQMSKLDINSTQQQKEHVKKDIAEHFPSYPSLKSSNLFWCYLWSIIQSI